MSNLNEGTFELLSGRSRVELVDAGSETIAREVEIWRIFWHGGMFDAVGRLIWQGGKGLICSRVRLFTALI